MNNNNNNNIIKQELMQNKQEIKPETKDKNKKIEPDRVNKFLIGLIKMVIVIILVSQLPDDIDTLRGITITIFVIGFVLAVLELFAPEIALPVKESFFMIIAWKILRK